jgi:hypothetical protein
VVHTALLKGAALGLDAGILIGTGTKNQPRGVMNLTGINTVAIQTPGSPTFPEMVQFETAITEDNALTGKLAYVTTSGVRGKLKTTPKAANTAIMIMENGEVNGYRLEASNLLPANSITFGNWADVLVGLWGVLDVNPDLATKAGSGGLVLRVFQDADVGIGHAESFAKNQ